VTFLQIKRLTGHQAAIGSGLGATAADPADSPGATTLPLPVIGAATAARPGAPTPGPALPDVSEVLDEAFGERP
jgi:hypothetical protein